MPAPNNEMETDITEVIGNEGSGRKRRRKSKYLIMAFVIIALVGAYLYSGKGDAAGYRYEKKTVEIGNLINTVSATGNLEPTNQVDVGSELSGIIDVVHVDYNDIVSVGHILALLDPTKLEAKVKQSQAALDSSQARVLQAKATVKETRAKLERMKQARELSGGKVPSMYDIEAAEASFERAEADHISAQASVAEARATLDSNKEDLSKAKIISPINGVVLDRSVEPGQTVAASLQAPVLFTLAEDLTQMELHVDVDEADVGMVQKGQEASFTVDAYPNRTFSAVITQVRYGAQITDGVVTYKTVLKVDNSDLLLRPGMTATADIIVQKVENKLLVPNAALRFRPPTRANANGKMGKSNSSMIFKIMPRPGRRRRMSEQGKKKVDIVSGSRQIIFTTDAGQLKKIPLVTGVTNGIMTEVVEGDLEPGMEVVVKAVKEVK